MTTPSRVALVTGASSGIGRAAAVELNAAGWTLILTARRRDALEDTVELMGDERHERTTIIVGDISRLDFVEVLFSIIRRDFGRLDLLFNNAGGGARDLSFEDVPLETFQEVFDLNLMASINCAQEAFRLMKSQQPQGGRIINNGSIAAYSPRPLNAAYTISKHAISGLTKAITMDGRAHRVVCSQLDIGNAQTGPEGTDKFAGKLQADGSKRDEPSFDVRLAGQAVVYMANLPLEVNIQNQTILATTMPFIGRG